MEQIYYTQCPVGYGLGASNGFQVKRLSRGYPMAGDFRHLGLKAFPGGGRTLAPPALRYRRDGEVAEVAWLTPRANEYETERGLWGRPGGHFAHGLRLDVEELKAIKRWPAGLFDSKLWVRTDREPSRGRFPVEIELATTSLFRPPTFSEVASLADREDAERLARLLTALAKVTREGRTLFVIDQPDRLGPLIALLTFAFPERLRDDLTFSTYHDRPEELPGYRLSGTIALARPNRPALTAQGVVADLTLGTFEPPIEPAAWARTLAGWLIRHDPVDDADWSSTDDRARTARNLAGTESVWSDEWLNPLHAYPLALRSRVAPADAAAWASLAEFTGWLSRSALAEEWVRPRDPGWWLEAAENAKDQPEARAALVSHATLRDAWRGDSRPAGWGQVIATWFRDSEPSERDQSIAAILEVMPSSARPSFARALLKGLTPEGAEAVLAQLPAKTPADQAVLLPLKASAAVTAILGGLESASLVAIIEEARTLPGATSGVLDAIEAGIADRPETLPTFAEIASGAFDLEAADEGREGIAWALRRGRLATIWLEPALRPVLAEPGRQGTWLALRDRTPEDLRATLATTVLAIAADDGLPEETFRWGVEGLLLPLAPRPSEATWAEMYLKRMPSDLDLYDRLVDREYRKLRVFDWLKEASGRGELSKGALNRISRCLDFYRVRKTKNAALLPTIRMPDVPADQRGALLEQMLIDLAGSSFEGLPFILGAARQAWPGAFEPGATGLRDLASPIARCLNVLRLAPANWLARLTRFLEHLGLTDADRRGFEPDSLAAEILAETTRLPEADPWALRKYFFKDNSLWRVLTVDVRRALDKAGPLDAPEVLLDWDKNLPMSEGCPGRIYELLLNACDGSQLSYSIAAMLPKIMTHPKHPWWGHGQFADAKDDLRDRFVRSVPLAPFPFGIRDRVAPLATDPTGAGDSKELVAPARYADERTLSLLLSWVAGKPSRAIEPDRFAAIKVTDEPEVLEARPGSGGSVPAHLSSQGYARWRCLLALTQFKNAVPANRCPIVWGWEKDLPLDSLSLDERHRFVAWLILGINRAPNFEPERLAKWLLKMGVKNPKRIGDWHEELSGLADVTYQDQVYRTEMNRDLRDELQGLLDQERDKKKPKPPAPRGD